MATRSHETFSKRSEPLSSSLDDPGSVPYFLWDEPMTVAELNDRLRHSSDPERVRLLGKILREARDTEAWRFTTPESVARDWKALSLHLGIRRAFWEFLFKSWVEQALLETARDLDVGVERLRTSSDFRRFLLTRGSESLVVDLVRELVPRIEEEKIEIRGIPVDSIREIMANKLCTLLSRAELRDLVDVRALEDVGLSVEEHLPLAAEKDAGLTAGQLAWVL